MVGKPEGIETPFLGAFGDARQWYRPFRHTEAEQSKPNTNFNMLHAMLLRLGAATPR